ncbi:MAG: hypothetical protein JNM01_11930 [Delftia acidovorans]|nr:hypothetical protein [Delftia acidovorans]
MSTWAADLGMGGGDAQIWSSSLVVTQGQVVQSPADWEFYKRIAATGSGATDPADDTTNYIAASYRRTLALPSRAPFLTTAAGSYYAANLPATSPRISQGVRTLIFSATGRGVVGFFGIGCSNAGILRVEMIIDGRTVYDSNVTMQGDNGWTLIGRTVNGVFASTNYPDYNALVDPYAPEFRRSVAVYVTPTNNSRNGTDRFASLVIGQG